MDEQSAIKQLYGHKLRLRVCGICIRENKVLLVRHSGLGEEGQLWIPPGGGMEWGQTAPQNLEREFLEETGLEVETGPLMFVHEYLSAPLHAVELFFRVRIIGGALCRGTDPELSEADQIIQEVGFLSFEEIKALPPAQLHAIFKYFRTLEALNNASGFFNFEK